MLLSCVVVVCTIEVDAVHSAYLALALYFFRRRVALRAERNALFFWLPLFNWLVMAATLVYQAPFQLLLPARHPDGNLKACTPAHLIGLFRLDPGESLLSLGYRGALADVLLWLLIRLQSHIFASATYDAVQGVVAQEEARDKRELLAEVCWWGLLRGVIDMAAPAVRLCHTLCTLELHAPLACRWRAGRSATRRRRGRRAGSAAPARTAWHGSRWGGGAAMGLCDPS